MNLLLRMGLAGLALGLTACTGVTGPQLSPTEMAGTRPPGPIEQDLPMIRSGAHVATGSVLDFAVVPSDVRNHLANQIYSAADGVYTQMGHSYPTPSKFQLVILSYGGRQTDANYTEFAAAITNLYAAYYPQLSPGETQKANDLLGAIADGLEDATTTFVAAPPGVVPQPPTPSAPHRIEPKVTAPVIATIPPTEEMPAAPKPPEKKVVAAKPPVKEKPAAPKPPEKKVVATKPPVKEKPAASKPPEKKVVAAKPPVKEKPAAPKPPEKKVVATPPPAPKPVAATSSTPTGPIHPAPQKFQATHPATSTAPAPMSTVPPPPTGVD